MSFFSYTKASSPDIKPCEQHTDRMECFLLFLCVIGFLEGISVNGPPKLNVKQNPSATRNGNGIRREKVTKIEKGQDGDNSNFSLPPLHPSAGEIIAQIKVPPFILSIETVVSLLSKYICTISSFLMCLRLFCSGGVGQRYNGIPPEDSPSELVTSSFSESFNLRTPGWITFCIFTISPILNLGIS